MAQAGQPAEALQDGRYEHVADIQDNVRLVRNKETRDERVAKTFECREQFEKEKEWAEGTDRQRGRWRRRDAERTEATAARLAAKTQTHLAVEARTHERWVERQAMMAQS